MGDFALTAVDKASDGRVWQGGFGGSECPPSIPWAEVGKKKKKKKPKNLPMLAFTHRSPRKGFPVESSTVHNGSEKSCDKETCMTHSFLDFLFKSEHLGTLVTSPFLSSHTVCICLAAGVELSPQKIPLLHFP